MPDIAQPSLLKLQSETHNFSLVPSKNQSNDIFQNLEKLVGKTSLMFADIMCKIKAFYTALAFDNLKSFKSFKKNYSQNFSKLFSAAKVDLYEKYLKTPKIVGYKFKDKSDLDKLKKLNSDLVPYQRIDLRFSKEENAILKPFLNSQYKGHKKSLFLNITDILKSKNTPNEVKDILKRKCEQNETLKRFLNKSSRIHAYGKIIIISAVSIVALTLIAALAYKYTNSLEVVPSQVLTTVSEIVDTDYTANEIINNESSLLPNESSNVSSSLTNEKATLKISSEMVTSAIKGLIFFNVKDYQRSILNLGLSPIKLFF